jgi:UDP-2,4-diacetamido-2,4,6-trideoxy-beta-L-altropyranose hydrolase
VTQAGPQSTMKKIGIICKTSCSQGIGHLVRQTHIAKALQNRGFEITFFIPDYQPALTQLDQQQLPYEILNDPWNFSKKEATPFDLILLDVQDTTETYIKELQKSKTLIVSFEDLGEGRNHVDLLIDCNLAPEQSAHITTQTLFGSSYCVLAPEFEMFHSKKRDFNESINSVLITFGGTDPHSLTATLAEKLLHIKPALSMTLLAGPGCKNIAALKDLQNNKVRLIESTSQMAQVLFDHDAVFCGGGVTLDEAMTVGTPAFVINQATHQEVKTSHAEKQGAAMSLGMAESWDENRLPEILLSSPESLRKMSQRGKSLIGGKGLKRVVNAIDKFMLIR